MITNNKNEFINNEDKKRQFGLFLIPLLLMWVLFSFNTDNVDYFTYNELYNVIPSLPLSNNVGLEVGYVFLFRLGNSLGLDYQQFNFLIGSFSIFLLYKFVNKYVINKTFVYFLYFIFPFFLDVVQSRNTIAYLLVLNSIIFLYKKQYIKYSLLVCFSSLFHISTLFFLIFLLINFKNYNLLKMIFIPLPFILIILRGVISRLLLMLPGGYKYAVYMNGTSFLVILIIYLILLAVYITSTLISKNNLQLNKHYRHLSSLQILFIESVPKLNLLLLLSIGLISLDVDFFRIIRNMMILNYMNLSFIIFKGRLLKNSGIFFCIIQFFLILILAFMFLYNNQIDSVILRIVNNNSLF